MYSSKRWGNASTLVRDDRTQLKVTNAIGNLTPDSTYRILALYTEDTTAQSAHLTSYAAVITAQAATYRSSSIITDPLSVQACWNSGGYINCHLTLKATNTGTHIVGFHKQALTSNADGTKTLNVLFIHNQNADPLYYSREAYLCMPLNPILQSLTAGRDSVALTFNTFEGQRTFRFPL